MIVPATSQISTASLVVPARARNIQSDSCAASATAEACLARPASRATRSTTTTDPASASGAASSEPPPMANPVTTMAAAAVAASAATVAGLDQDLPPEPPAPPEPPEPDRTNQVTGVPALASRAGMLIGVSASNAIAAAT